jgi:hypothetical protein
MCAVRYGEKSVQAKRKVWYEIAVKERRGVLLAGLGQRRRDASLRPSMRSVSLVRAIGVRCGRIVGERGVGAIMAPHVWRLPPCCLLEVLCRQRGSRPSVKYVLGLSIAMCVE